MKIVQTEWGPMLVGKLPKPKKIKVRIPVPMKPPKVEIPQNIYNRKRGKKELQNVK